MGKEKNHFYTLGEPTYKVQLGDNLYNIAKAYRLSLSRLMKYNNLTSNSILKPGQILYLDFSAEKAKARKNKNGLKGKYTIQEGDNLGFIALRLGVSVKSLKKNGTISGPQGFKLDKSCITAQWIIPLFARFLSRMKDSVGTDRGEIIGSFSNVENGI